MDTPRRGCHRGVAMKRVHTVELEDFDWFPTQLRTYMTNLLVVLARLVGVTPVLAKLVGRTLDDLGTRRIVDLGSGSGGVMPDVVRQLRSEADHADVELTLSDLHPNPDAVARFSGDDGIRYAAERVDATDLAEAPPGLKTMVNCFHHMRPDQARKILASARDARQPLLVYEMSDNTVPFVVWLLLLPLVLPLVAISAWVLTPMVRPLTPGQLVFTYLVPIVPICYAWDGQTSMPRIYGLADLDELLEELQGDGYRWEKGPATDESGKKTGIYLLGVPTDDAA